MQQTHRYLARARQESSPAITKPTRMAGFHDSCTTRRCAECKSMRTRLQDTTPSTLGRSLARIGFDGAPRSATCRACGACSTAITHHSHCTTSAECNVEPSSALWLLQITKMLANRPSIEALGRHALRTQLMDACQDNSTTTTLGTDHAHTQTKTHTINPCSLSGLPAAPGRQRPPARADQRQK